MKQQAVRGAQLSKPNFIPVFSLQVAALIVLAAALYFMTDEVTAYSALLGGSIAIGPNFYFALQAFRYSGARAASEVASSFYRGEAGKFVMTAMGFAVCFAAVKPLDAAATFLTYIFMVVLNWMLALTVMKKRAAHKP